LRTVKSPFSPAIEGFATIQYCGCREGGQISVKSLSVSLAGFSTCGNRRYNQFDIGAHLHEVFDVVSAFSLFASSSSGTKMKRMTCQGRGPFSFL
jgi:hypothetical protein